MQRSTQTVWGRMIGAAALNPNAYDAVKTDERATTTAIVIVLFTSIATGIGALVASGVSGFLWAIVINLAVWITYTGVVYVVGVTMFKSGRRRTRFGDLMRPLAFAQVPAILLVVSGMQAVSGLLGILISIWILANTVVAVRQTFSLKTGTATGIAVAAWLLVLPVRYVILMVR